jgi:hypothetical protein
MAYEVGIESNRKNVVSLSDSLTGKVCLSMPPVPGDKSRLDIAGFRFDTAKPGFGAAKSALGKTKSQPDTTNPGPDTADFPPDTAKSKPDTAKTSVRTKQSRPRNLLLFIISSGFFHINSELSATCAFTALRRITAQIRIPQSAIRNSINLQRLKHYGRSHTRTRTQNPANPRRP